ncbi:MAG TPA: hypothetical protein VMX16_11370 [Terriglobia bacterium]|nr:hypothetical protein [Terriglobia bacterium]
MKVFTLMLLVFLGPATTAALESADMASICAGAAKVFFLVAPIVFMVGSAIGLLSRSRA